MITSCTHDADALICADCLESNELKNLRAENARLRAALEYYAQDEFRGDRARNALGKEAL